jgi:DNA mismatch endonuclease (patch repair protein)
MPLKRSGGLGYTAAGEQDRAEAMSAATNPGRSEVMRRIGRKDTPPELAVRRVLHRLGLRFRLHRADLPGRPDIVLPRWRTVIFVHGCFWHGCARCYRGHRVPKTNRNYWLNKVRKNRARDARSCSLLESDGWRVLTTWECETADEEALAVSLGSFFRLPDRGW